VSAGLLFLWIGLKTKRIAWMAISPPSARGSVVMWIAFAAFLAVVAGVALLVLARSPSR